jgi:hypothetical protein
MNTNTNTFETTTITKTNRLSAIWADVRNGQYRYLQKNSKPGIPHRVSR